MRLARAWHCRAGRVKSVSKRSFQPQWQAPGRASLEHRAWQTATLRHRGAKCELEPVHGLGVIGSDCPVHRLRLRHRRAHGALDALARRFVAHRARELGRRAAVIWCVSSRRGSVLPMQRSARPLRNAVITSVDASVRRTLPAKVTELEPGGVRVHAPAPASVAPSTASDLPARTRSAPANADQVALGLSMAARTGYACA